MPALRTLSRSTAALLATTALGLTLAGCKVENRPLLARGEAPAYAPAPGDLAYAPDASALPYAPPAQLAPAGLYDGYALAERAYSHDRVAYRAPPSYGFRYGEVEPWVWQTAGDDLMFAEPVDDGFRTYYYEPGEPYPYFVRDDDYGYAYGDNGALAAVFDATGALLPDGRFAQVADIAGRYLARGYDLRQVYVRQPRIAVAEPVWSQYAPRFIAAEEPWISAVERQPAWREYRVSTGDRIWREFESRPIQREVAAAHAPRGNPPPWAPAHGLRERRGEAAPNVFQHTAPVVAHEDRRAARDFAKAERREAKDFAKAERHAFKQERHEAQAFARNDAPGFAPPQPHEHHANVPDAEHGHGKGGDHGGGDHGGGRDKHGGGGDNGHGHGKH